jgi:C4-dicarboxylate-specific signal transduction histidine kinase
VVVPVKILIVDDEPVFRQTLVSIVTFWGYEAVPAENGAEALEILSRPDAPSVALVDWVMPEITGIELCEKVKLRNSSDKFVYMILLTGRKDSNDIIAGLNSGADDYIVKPFEHEELKSRIAVGVRTVEYERKLSAYAKDMERLAEERAAQLIHAERLSTLGELAAGIAHEINNYISPASGYIKIMELQLEQLLTVSDKDKAYFRNAIRQTGDSIAKIERLVGRLKKHSRKRQDEKSLTNINNIVRQAAELCHSKLKFLDYAEFLSQDLKPVSVNSQEIEQVIVNILKNAADELDRDGIIRVYTSMEDDRLVISIEDNGPGIPEDGEEKIFESFFTTKDEERGTGLGLSVSKEIIESHGGRIFAEKSEMGGAAFVIELPVEI